MVQVTNKLVEERGIDAAQEYTNFGIRHLDEVNERAERWLREQSFVEAAPSPEYGEIIIGGRSNYKDYQGKKVGDSVEWDLRFKDPSKLGNFSFLGWFHAGRRRLPSLVKHNSAPGITTNKNYFQISVSNNERGWVERGEFPTGVYVHNGQTISERGLKRTQKAVFTETKRDSEVGFRAALEWAKFRAMALACDSYLLDRLREEWENGTKDFDARRSMRDRNETAYDIMLGLFPDTRMKSGSTALRSYYVPGVLEATLALELERGGRGNHARKNGPSPISELRAFPIEITHIPGKAAEYDAVLPVRFSFRGSPREGSEVAREVLEEHVRRYFDASMNPNLDLDVRIHIPNANKIRELILDGAEETPLQIQARSLLELSERFSESFYSWDETSSDIRRGHEAMLEAAERNHFERGGRGFWMPKNWIEKSE